MMQTKINAKIFAQMYEMSYSNYHNYIAQHQRKIKSLATTFINRIGKKVTKRDYNTLQLNYIVNDVFKGETPYGFTFNGKFFVKNKD